LGRSIGLTASRAGFSRTGFSLLYRRQGIYRFRRVVPVALREVIGRREVKVSLRTTELQEAKRRAATESLRVDKLFDDARRLLQNPAARAYRLVQETIEDHRRRPRTDEELEAEEMAVTTALENEKDPIRVQGLRRLLDYYTRDGDEGEDNPPLSILFDRWRAERRPSAKSWREFDLALRRFVAVNGDLPVRTIDKGHVRALKASLLASPSTRDTTRTLSVASVQKLLNAVHAVLEWSTREGYTDHNVAHGVSRVSALNAKAATEDRRLPFSLEHVQMIFSKLPVDKPMRWLPLLTLYTGARLSELVGLRPTEVKEEDSVLYLDIRPQEVRGLKNRTSRRRVPVHPELLRQGFSREVLPFKPQSGHYWSRRLMKWLREDVGITDPRLVMHSARHTVADRLRAAGVPEDVRDALLGHAGGGTGRRYGTAHPLSTLQAAVAKIEYPGVKLPT
jgi:integrase